MNFFVLFPGCNLLGTTMLQSGVGRVFRKGGIGNE